MTDMFRLFIELCRSNPLTGFFTLCAVYYLLKYTVVHTTRTMRVAFRGWPTAPLMDADGDIVHPEKDESP